MPIQAINRLLRGVLGKGYKMGSDWSSDWGDTGNGPGFSGYVGPPAFKVVEPKPKGDGWPALKADAEAKHDYEASEDTAPHRMHTDAPCTCGLPKRHPDHR